MFLADLEKLRPSQNQPVWWQCCQKKGYERRQGGVGTVIVTAVVVEIHAGFNELASDVLELTSELVAVLEGDVVSRGVEAHCVCDLWD